MAALGLLMSYGSYKFSKKMIAEKQASQKQPEKPSKKRLDALEEGKEEFEKAKSTT